MRSEQDIPKGCGYSNDYGVEVGSSNTPKGKSP